MKTFEEKIKEVEFITDILEKGQIGLKESVEKYECGMKLLEEMEKELDQINQKLTVIRQEADGTIREVSVKTED